jgi:hypothetical protein
MAVLNKEKILDELIYVKKEMPEVHFRREILEGKVVHLIFDAVKKEMYHLKGNSGRIWHLMDGKRTIDMIAHKLAAETNEKDKNLLLQDVIRFVVKLGRFKLIKFAYKTKLP